jgi:hypothetical protein
LYFRRGALGLRQERVREARAGLPELEDAPEEEPRSHIPGNVGTGSSNTPALGRGILANADLAVSPRRSSRDRAESEVPVKMGELLPLVAAMARCSFRHFPATDAQSAWRWRRPITRSCMEKPPPLEYAKKFEGFIRMCDEAKTKGLKAVVVAHPSVTGDNYDEIIEGLSRLARAELALAIARPE